MLAADAANFSGRISINETHAITTILSIRRIALEELDAYGGSLQGLPGDGIMAIFESAIDALMCALDIQKRLSALETYDTMKLRIGIHLGELIYENDLPFGEALAIAARLESLADPGGVLVSGSVMEATSARVSARFEDRGVPRLKNMPRRIHTYSVTLAQTEHLATTQSLAVDPLEHTAQLKRTSADLGKLSINPQEVAEEAGRARASRDAGGSLAERLAKAGSPPEAPGLPLPGAPTPPTVAEPPLSAPQPPQPVPPAQPEPHAQPAAPSPVAPATVVFAPELVAELGAALTLHLGPLARMLLARQIKSAKSVSGLCLSLEKEIPNEDERLVFRRAASDICARYGA